MAKWITGALTWLAAFAALASVSVVVEGYVASRLWGWFIAPRFGLPVLGTVGAASVALTVQVFRPVHTWRPDDDPKALKRWFANEVVSPVLILGVGYVLHRWLSA